MDPSFLISKSDQLLASTNASQRTQLQTQFTELISNIDNLQFCLQLITQSPSFLFIFNQILAKTLQKGRYLNIDHLIQSRIQANEPEIKQSFTQAITEKKKKAYGTIISTLSQFFTVGNLPSHTKNQCINVIGLCLKSLCEGSEDQLLFAEMLVGLFPGVQINVEMVNSYTVNQPLIKVDGSVAYIPNNFQISCKIVHSLIEYIQVSAYYRSYFDFRRSVYNFKSQYITYLVQLVVYYLKTLVLKGQTKGESITLILQIFEQLMSYPYSLNIHEYDTEEDIRETSRGEIYFPPIMKLVLHDEQIFQFFGVIYEQNNVTKNYELVKKDMLLILKILSKLFSANSYFFDSDGERIKLRKNAVMITMNILNKLFFVDRSFIVPVLDLIARISGLYALKDYGDQLVPFVFQVLNFCKLIISKCPIVVDSEPTNPVSMLFNILVELHHHAESQLYKFEYNNVEFKPRREIMAILQEYFVRITKQQDISYVGEPDWEKEIESFTHFYSTFYDVFKLNETDHLASLLNLDFSSLSPLSHQFWVYFICTLVNQNSFLQNHSPSKLLLIHKVFMSIKDINYLFVFKFIDLITSKFLEESVSNRTQIWNTYHEHSGIQFEEFIVFIIKKLISTIYTDDQLFMYVIKILNNIYVSLKKINEGNMKTYSLLLNDLIINLQKTLFANPNFYKMRVDLYSLISTIWIEQNCHTKQGMNALYNVYKAISQNFKTNIIIYLYDARGLLCPIDAPSPYKVVCELIIQDVQTISQNSNKVQQLMSNEIARNAMIKLALEISNDQFSRIKFKDHRSLPSKIQKTFRPFLVKAATYPYGKSLLKAYNNFISLTPISQALPLPPKQNCIKPFLQHQINTLITNYFQNIHKVSDLNSLYNYIGDNGDFLHYWCQEIVARETHIDPAMLRSIVESKCWKGCRMMEMAAKSVWIMGNYDLRYRVVGRLWEGLNQDDMEEDFEERFERYMGE